MKVMTSCLRGMDSDLENSKNINTRIELLDGTQDKAFEESDLDGCRENDIETDQLISIKSSTSDNITNKQQQQKNNQEKRARTLNNDCVLKLYRVSIATVAVAWLALINKDSEHAWICVNVVHTTTSGVPAGITSSVYPEILNLFSSSSISCEPNLEFNRIKLKRHKHIVDKHI
ncbi:hypothetical protein GQX74_001164 [Glossina fuscipes]|nr:hypothetical protein GQX74_001164 [Glossina fuscipes]